MISIAYPMPLLTKLSLLVPRGRGRNVIGTSVIWHAFLSGADEEFWLNLKVLRDDLVP